MPVNSTLTLKPPANDKINDKLRPLGIGPELRERKRKCDNQKEQFKILQTWNQKD